MGPGGDPNQTCCGLEFGSSWVGLESESDGQAGYRSRRYPSMWMDVVHYFMDYIQPLHVLCVCIFLDSANPYARRDLFHLARPLGGLFDQILSSLYHYAALHAGFYILLTSLSFVPPQEI